VAAIIAKAAQKYINAFCRDFDHDQLNLQLFKGDIVLDNVVLNEAVLQSLLHLPESLRLESARAARVHINLSWSRLKTQPIQISIGSLVIVLAEPPRTAPLPPNAPLPSFLRPPSVEKLKRKAQEQAKAVAAQALAKDSGGKDAATKRHKRRWADAMFENLRLAVDDVHIVVRTRGRPRERGGTESTDPPLIHAHIHKFSLESTDGDWKVAELAALLAARKAAGSPLVDVRKLVKISRMTLAVGGAAGEPGAVTLASLGAAAPGSPLADEAVVRVITVPLEMRFLLQRNGATSKIVGLDFAIEIADFNVKFTLAQWKRAMWAVEGLLWCLERTKELKREKKRAQEDGDGAPAAKGSAAAPALAKDAAARHDAAKPGGGDLELEPIALSEGLRELDELNADDDEQSEMRVVHRATSATAGVNGELTEAALVDEPFGHVRVSFALNSVAVELMESTVNGWNVAANDLRVVLCNDKSRSDDSERRASRMTQLFVRAAFAAVRDKRPGAPPIMAPQTGHRDAPYMVDANVRFVVDAKDAWKKPAQLSVSATLAPIVVVADRVSFNGFVSFIKSHLPVSPAKAAKAAKRAAKAKSAAASDEHDSDDDDADAKAARAKEKLTRRERRRQQLIDLRNQLAPSAAQIAPLASFDVRLQIGAFKLQVPGMRVGKREGATLELIVGGVTLRSLPLVAEGDDDAAASVRFQGRVSGLSVCMSGEADDPACGDLLAPFDIQLHVEQRRYLAVVRQLAGGGLQQAVDTMMADECRTEVSLTVAPIRIDLTPMQYATLLQAHVPVLDMLARHRARARNRTAKKLGRIERLQDKVNRGLGALSKLYFPFYARFAMARFRFRLIGFPDEPFGYTRLLSEMLARTARLQRSAPLLPAILEFGFGTAEIVLQHREYDSLKGRAALEAPLVRIRQEALLVPIDFDVMPTTGAGVSQVANSQSSVTITYDHVRDAEGAPHVVRMHAAGMLAQVREKGPLTLKLAKDLAAELKKLTTKTAPKIARDPPPEKHKGLPRTVAFDVDAGDCEVRLVPYLENVPLVLGASDKRGSIAVAVAAANAAASAHAAATANANVPRDQLPLTAVPPAITFVISPADRRQLAAAAARGAALLAEATRTTEDAVRAAERREKGTKEALRDMEQTLIAAKLELAQVQSQLSALANDVSSTKRREEEANARMQHMQQLNLDLWAVLETGKPGAASSGLRNAIARLKPSSSSSASIGASSSSSSSSSPPSPMTSSSSTVISSSSGQMTAPAVRSFQTIVQSMSEGTLAAQNRAMAAERVSLQLEKQLATLQARIEGLVVDREQLRQTTTRDIAELEERCRVLAEERDTARQLCDTREEQLLHQQRQFAQARDEITALDERVRELTDAEQERAAKEAARERRREQAAAAAAAAAAADDKAMKRSSSTYGSLKKAETPVKGETATSASSSSAAASATSTIAATSDASKRTESGKIEKKSSSSTGAGAADDSKKKARDMLSALEAEQSDEEKEKKTTFLSRMGIGNKDKDAAEVAHAPKSEKKSDKKDKDKDKDEKKEKKERKEKKKDDDSGGDKTEKKSVFAKLKEKREKRAAAAAAKKAGVNKTDSDDDVDDLIDQSDSD
jgi:hypothetical protein